MKNLLLLFLLGFNAQAQVASVVYDFEKPTEQSFNSKAEVRTFFNSSSRDFETMEMEALLFQKRGSFKIKSRELEQLVIVKKGEVGFSIPKSNRIMGPGSIALLMPGDKLNLLVNPGDQIYVMKYKAREGQSLSRGKKMGGHFSKTGKSKPSKPTIKGASAIFTINPQPPAKEWKCTFLISTPVSKATNRIPTGPRKLC